MRLGKMCGLLMKAFLAVLMLFVTAAAVEVYWEDEFDEAIANQCESIILKEEYLNMDFGEAIVVDFVQFWTWMDMSLQLVSKSRTVPK